MPYCVSCCENYIGFCDILCSGCKKQLLAARQHGPGTSLFIYNGTLRKLVLAAKIKGNSHCLAYFLAQIAQNKRAKHELEQCEEIIPAPSSLYSRLKGRTDVAYFLASALAKKHGKKLQLAPQSLYWQLQKQSQKKQRTPLLLAPSDKKFKPALIVDDVITSGYTFQKIAKSLKDRSFRFLVIGDGRTRPDKNLSLG